MEAVHWQYIKNYDKQKKRFNRSFYWKSSIFCTCRSFWYRRLAVRGWEKPKPSQGNEDFYAELDMDSYDSMLIGKNTHLVFPIRQEEFLPIKGIKRHFQFVCFNKGSVGVRDFPRFCQNCYTCAIYYCTKLGKDFTLGACIRSAMNKRYF